MKPFYLVIKDSFFKLYRLYVHTVILSCCNCKGTGPAEEETQDGTLPTHKLFSLGKYFQVSFLSQTL